MVPNWYEYTFLPPLWLRSGISPHSVNGMYTPFKVSMVCSLFPLFALSRRSFNFLVRAPTITLRHFDLRPPPPSRCELNHPSLGIRYSSAPKRKTVLYLYHHASSSSVLYLEGCNWNFPGSPPHLFEVRGPVFQGSKAANESGVKEIWRNRGTRGADALDRVPW